MSKGGFINAKILYFKTKYVNFWLTFLERRIYLGGHQLALLCHDDWSFAVGQSSHLKQT